MADRFERMATDWFAEWFPTTNFARADIARLAALLSRVDAEATERAAKVCGDYYEAQINSDVLSHRVAALGAAHCEQRIRSTLPTPAARAGEDGVANG